MFECLPSPGVREYCSDKVINYLLQCKLIDKELIDF